MYIFCSLLDVTSRCLRSFVFSFLLFLSRLSFKFIKGTARWWKEFCNSSSRLELWRHERENIFTFYVTSTPRTCYKTRNFDYLEYFILLISIFKSFYFLFYTHFIVIVEINMKFVVDGEMSPRGRLSSCLRDSTRDRTKQREDLYSNWTNWSW